jgi:hypothetical protein
MYEICENLLKQEDFLKLNCLYLDFKPWAINNTASFPVEPEKFHHWITKFCVEMHRLKSVENGFIDDRLV